jgi:TatD DNase family protein
MLNRYSTAGNIKNLLHYHRLINIVKKKYLYFNLHSHHKAATPDTVVLQSIYKNFEAIDGTGFYSAGLHPWYINENWQPQLQLLQITMQQQSVWAVGECGLDKICPTLFTLQQEVFTQQLLLANRVNKPVIIHCVKAWQEVFTLLDELAMQVPVIFHGFAKNEILAKQILEKGYYLSFGKALQQQHMQHLLKKIPLQHVLLETDDAAISIETVYNWAAQALSTDINSLSLQLQKNAQTVFKNKKALL